MFMLNETLVQRQQLIRDVYRTPIIISSGQMSSVKYILKQFFKPMDTN